MPQIRSRRGFVLKFKPIEKKKKSAYKIRTPVIIIIIIKYRRKTLERMSFFGALTIRRVLGLVLHNINTTCMTKNFER